MLDFGNIFHFAIADIGVKWKQDQDYFFYKSNHMISYKFV
jgi:hypothetical protein